MAPSLLVCRRERRQRLSPPRTREGFRSTRVKHVSAAAATAWRPQNCHLTARKPRATRITRESIWRRNRLDLRDHWERGEVGATHRSPPGLSEPGDRLEESPGGFQFHPVEASSVQRLQTSRVSPFYAPLKPRPPDSSRVLGRAIRSHLLRA